MPDRLSVVDRLRTMSDKKLAALAHADDEPYLRARAKEEIERRERNIAMKGDKDA